MAVKTWFITGTSRGFGREWAIAALDRGHKVAATARNASNVDDLAAKHSDAILPIRLDLTDRDAGFAAVRQAHEYFGRLDVIVNNAGYGQFGMVEEISEQELRAQLGTNLLGALDHPGGPALPARAGQRAPPACVIDRRHLGVHEYRRLPRLEMGPGRAEPEPGPGGGRVRHQGHADRACG
jgi:NAD(P)-dependent dehydrogenase (short-subunit alcohol dehydrogenase family)